MFCAGFFCTQKFFSIFFNFFRFLEANHTFHSLYGAERGRNTFQRILKSRGKAQQLIVGGYSNFLFLNREGLPKVAGNYEGMVRGLIKKYNKYHKDKLPNITPHSFRHTYCTNMANRGMNPNTLQYLMGHANITMTLGYYAHGTFQSAKAELERLAC